MFVAKLFRLLSFGEWLFVDGRFGFVAGRYRAVSGRVASGRAVHLGESSVWAIHESPLASCSWYGECSI